jgi:hypothetical protein
MTVEPQAAPDRAVTAAREPAPRAGMIAPLVAVGVATLSALVLYLAEGREPGEPTPPMPVPHVQAPAPVTGTPQD